MPEGQCQRAPARPAERSRQAPVSARRARQQGERSASVKRLAQTWRQVPVPQEAQVRSVQSATQSTARRPASPAARATTEQWTRARRCRACRRRSAWTGQTRRQGACAFRFTSACRQRCQVKYAAWFSARMVSRYRRLSRKRERDQCLSWLIKTLQAPSSGRSLEPARNSGVFHAPRPTHGCRGRCVAWLC